MKVTASPLDTFSSQFSKPAGVPSSDPSSTSRAKGREDSSASGNSKGKSHADPSELSPERQRLLNSLKDSDRKVRDHEAAHLRAAGGYAQGGASYEFRRGPDGKQYAVAGDVRIDAGPESTPSRTIAKMKVVIRAALAPADPSAQDRRVASQARQAIAQAYQEMQAVRLDASAEGQRDGEEDGQAPAAPTLSSIV